MYLYSLCLFLTVTTSLGLSCMFYCVQTSHQETSDLSATSEQCSYRVETQTFLLKIQDISSWIYFAQFSL